MTHPRPQYASNGLKLTHDLDGTPYGSKPYRPSPARRQYIYGPIESMDQPERVLPSWSLWFVGAIAATFIASYIGASA